MKAKDFDPALISPNLGDFSPEGFFNVPGSAPSSARMGEYPPVLAVAPLPINFDVTPESGIIEASIRAATSDIAEYYTCNVSQVIFFS
jgi:hypothetical protein